MQYWLTRLCLQRSLGLIYLIAFLIALNQGRALIGANGLLPMRLYLPQVSFPDAPGIFWWVRSDQALTAVCWAGLALAALAVSGVSERFGFAVSAAVWAGMWLLYLSLVNVGQTFWGFGWEILLLEAGFLAIFLGPAGAAPPAVVIWLFRWLAFRVMLGAGLIKLRGDPCWRDLSCMFYHYETQPLPGPLSWYFHNFPEWVHKGEVLINHVVELVVPFGLFGPAPVRTVCGALVVLFQLTLIFSGNLAWLNYVTIAVTLSCFDDAVWERLLFFVAKPASPAEASAVHEWITYALAVVVGGLSIRPVMNLVSPGQAMNQSFDALHLVNTYGAFGSVTRTRSEIILEGTRDAEVSPMSAWTPYEFKAKPGDVRRRPPLVSPYLPKLDWQMWFAAMGDYRSHPWILNLVAKLLKNDPEVVGLLGPNPFPDAPPQWVRAERYIYRFAPADQKAAGDYWVREFDGEYLPPLSLKDASFQRILLRLGWLDAADMTDE